MRTSLDLRSAAVPETGVGATVDATFEPLLQAVLRPASATWHGRPDLAAAAATAAATRIGELRDSVRVLTPPSPYSLGTSDAPLLLAIANGLPVTMEVRLSISSTTGPAGRADPAAADPAAGAAAGAGRRGGRAVGAVRGRGDGAHRRPAVQLGPPSRLQVRSTAYGTITVWLTGSAAVLLVVLAARRVVRRVRGEPSPRDRTGPSVGPPDMPRSRHPDDAGDPTPPTDPRRRARNRSAGGTGAPDGPADGPVRRRRTRNPAHAPVRTPPDRGASDPSGTGPPPVTHADRRAGRGGADRRWGGPAA